MTSCRDSYNTEPVSVIMSQHITGDDSTIGYQIFTKAVEKEGFSIKREKLNAYANCIESHKIERYKVANDILYISVNINNIRHWLPYLFLEPGKCIVHPQFDHFGTVSVSNCTLERDSLTTTFQQKIERVNGDMESEYIITLNKDFLPVQIVEISLPFDEIPSTFNKMRTETSFLKNIKRCNMSSTD